MAQIKPERPKNMTVVVPSDDLEWRNTEEEPLGKDENGNPQYPSYRIHGGETITRYVMLPSSVLSAMLKHTSLLAAGEIQSALADQEDNVKRVLARVIVDWTWTSFFTGEPLPCPHNNPQAFDDLDMQEMNYLISVALGGTRTPKN